MSLPIILQLFSCGDEGLLKPIEPPDPLGGQEQPKDLSWVADAMPLVLIPPIEGSLQDAFDVFEQQANAINFIEGATRSLGTVTFTEYSFTHTDTSLTSVYALTSGHLYYLAAGTSNSELLSGAIPNEDVLILKPLKSILDIYWPDSHPGRKPLLEECAYLNVSLVSDENLKLLILKSNTEEYFKKVYKIKRGSGFQGTDWGAEYLKLFKEFPDVPVLVRGGAQIGSTKSHTQTDPTQRITLLFKFTSEGQEVWTGIGHDEAVKTFFRYYRRRGSGLSGHPLIAKLIGQPVQSGTVDVVGPELQEFNLSGPVQSPSPTDPLLRTKSSLISFFKQFPTSTDHHPLALDPDDHPHRLIIPKQPTSEIPPYLVPALGPNHDWVTKLKIENPLGLEITIAGFNPAEVSIDPCENITATRSIVELRANETLSPGTIERTIQIKADGAVVHEIVLTFLDFHAVPVKFYKLSDTNPIDQTVIHQADMDEHKLGEVIAYANEILGRQTNVHLFPIPIEEVETILHEDVHQGVLGDPMTAGEVNRFSESFFADGVGDPKYINVVFVWNQEGIEHTAGVTNFPKEMKFALIFVDTKNPDGALRMDHMAQTLVHELGHWFSHIFIRVPNTLPDVCSGSYAHFGHPDDSNKGCPGGNWSFYGNLMGGDLLITIEQARVFNDHAHEVLP